MEKSRRNMITFTNFANIDYTICNVHLEELIKNLSARIDFKSFQDNSQCIVNFTLRCNEYNWSCVITYSKSKVNNTQLIDKLNKIHELYIDKPCCYLEINKMVMLDGKFKDIYDLEYHPLSFRQPDDTIRTSLIQYFQDVNLESIDI